MDSAGLREHGQKRPSADDVYKALMEASTDLMVLLHPDGRVACVNPAARTTLGYRSDELVDHHFSEFIDEDERPRAASLFNAATRGRPHVREGVRVRHRDGRPVDFTMNSRSVLDSQGRCAGVVVIASDMSSRRLHAADLQEGDLAWRRRIMQAIERDELLAFSQPIIDLRSGRQVQEELLIRMRGEGPDEVMLPDQFLPHAERLGLITEIDRWMLRQAIALVDRGRMIELNLSALSMNDPGLIDEIATLTEAAGIPADHLIFEITETAATENIERAAEFGERLEGLGCRLALDDFGTGFGAMTYLKSLPSDFLKIAMEFIADVITDEADQRVVKTIVGIAREHGQRTIAEGVEDWDTAAMLREYGVDYAQGYLFGAAQPLE
jgi:PAS domain S-box-containing protein